MTPSFKPEDEEAAYRHARERAEAIQGLYIHLLVYVVINAGLFALNWFTTGGEGGWWFVWPLAGWGIGLLVHALVVAAPVFSSDWVDRKTQKIIANRRN